MVRGFIDEVQAWSKEYEFHSFVGWQRKEKTDNPFVSYTDNNQRLTVPNNHKAVKKIWYLGSSVMWGFGQDDQHTIPSQIARQFPDYEHINMAEQGFNSRQSLNKLLNVLSAVQPGDIVITLDGQNEATHLCDAPSLPSTHIHNDQFKRKIDESLSQPLSYLAGFKPNKTYTARLMRRISNAITNPTLQPRYQVNRCEDPSRANEVALFLKNNWEVMSSILYARDAKLLCILQPSASRHIYDVPSYDLDVIAQEKLESTYPLFRDKGSELDYFRDYSEFFDTYVFIDGIAHLNEQGASRLATAFANEIGDLSL